MAPASVSVIVPVYNEAARIACSLEKILAYLREKFPVFEIIAVNDGSTDGTAKALAQFDTSDGGVKIISLSVNHGKGFAVRRGVLEATKDVVFFTDADLSSPVETIEVGLKKISEGYPVVIASRRHPGSAIAVRQPRVREKVGVAFNLLVKALVGLPFSDTQCGFKGFTREAAKEIFPRTRIHGFSFDVEVLVIARRLGYSIAEIPVNWSDAEGSKVRVGRHLLRVLSELLAIYWNNLRGVYGGEEARREPFSRA